MITHHEIIQVKKEMRSIQEELLVDDYIAVQILMLTAQRKIANHLEALEHIGVQVVKPQP